MPAVLGLHQYMSLWCTRWITTIDSAAKRWSTCVIGHMTHGFLLPGAQFLQGYASRIKISPFSSFSFFRSFFFLFLFVSEKVIPPISWTKPSVLSCYQASSRLFWKVWKFWNASGVTIVNLRGTILYCTLIKLKLRVFLRTVVILCHGNYVN